MKFDQYPVIYQTVLRCQSALKYSIHGVFSGRQEIYRKVSNITQQYG